MRLLEKIEHPKGTGVPGLTSTLIERTKTKAIYERSDGCYEVFKVEIHEAGVLPGGKTIPEREHYPSNEDFGKIAWCFSNRKLAEQRYKGLK